MLHWVGSPRSSVSTRLRPRDSDISTGVAATGAMFRVCAMGGVASGATVIGLATVAFLWLETDILEDQVVEVRRHNQLMTSARQLAAASAARDAITRRGQLLAQLYDSDPCADGSEVRLPRDVTANPFEDPRASGLPLYFVNAPRGSHAPPCRLG